MKVVISHLKISIFKWTYIPCVPHLSLISSKLCIMCITVFTRVHFCYFVRGFLFITRFNPEEKAKRSPFHWMPFGYGPRNCIGMRLALFEMKVVIVQLLKEHKLVKCAKTEVRKYFI